MKREETTGEEIRRKADKLRKAALEELRRRGVPESEIQKVKDGETRRPESGN